MVDPRVLEGLMSISVFSVAKIIVDDGRGIGTAFVAKARTSSMPWVRSFSSLLPPTLSAEPGERISRSSSSGPWSSSTAWPVVT
jgi:hypothetical protein